MAEDPCTPADDADSLLIEQIARLRDIGPSPAAQDYFHQLVAAELVATRHAHATAWWRRSIRVPLPICIAVGLAMFAVLFARLPDAAERSTGLPTLSPTAPATKPEPTYRTTSTYVLGVGALATETRYFSSKD